LKFPFDNQKFPCQQKSSQKSLLPKILDSTSVSKSSHAIYSNVTDSYPSVDPPSRLTGIGQSPSQQFTGY